MTQDYLRYYFLENYVFDDVREHFHRDKKLDAFDLFSIIIWKANRAKSTLAHRLIKKCKTLECAAAQFTQALYAAPTAQYRLQITMEEWGFYLPMASAILSVLWPDEFTIYDVRVCSQLEEDFRWLNNIKPKAVWPEYERYRQAVEKAVPKRHSLRDKDRVLWGKSAALQLRDDIAAGFPAK